MKGAGENEFAKIRSVRYYFTSRKKRGQGNINVDRSAGAGYWKARQPPKNVIDEDGTVIAEKRTFTYWLPPPDNEQGTNHSRKNFHKTHWHMVEYELKKHEVPLM